MFVFNIIDSNLSELMDQYDISSSSLTNLIDPENFAEMIGKIKYF